MNEKKIDRRKFLQAVGAAAALAGLSHFRFLNIDAHIALANPLDACDQGQAVADYCNPGEDPDTCPDPTATSSDVCIPERGEPDECMTGVDPDICDPADQPPDKCDPAHSDPDECERPPGGPDTCGPPGSGNPDVCPDGGPPSGDGDICNETGPNANPDECIPAVGESDSCSATAEPDFCRDPVGGPVVHDICDPAQNDPDICIENGQNVVDTCAPPDDPDAPPNAVALRSFTGRSVGGAAPLALGGLAVLAGAAAVARHRSGPALARGSDAE
jgi:hypothetical protein